MEINMKTQNRLPYVIGIAGGTASGKSTMARTIIDKVGNYRVAYIEYDWYYKDLSHLPIEERFRTNFDHPDSLDTDFLVEQLKKIRNGDAVNAPQYDFKTCTRLPDTKEIKPKDIVIVDGILALSNPELQELYDLKIFVDMDADERLSRRLERDVKERGRSVESVINQYRNTVKPMHDQFVEPWKQFADIVVPGEASKSRALDAIAGQVLDKIERARVRSGLNILQSIGLLKPNEGSQNVLSQIVEIAAHEMGADNVTLHQYDNATKEFLDPEIYSATWPVGSVLQKPRQHGYSSYVVKSENGSLYVPDIDSEKNPDLVLVKTAHLSGSGTKAFLGVRLDAGGDTVGIIFFNYLNTRRIDEDEKEWAYTIANYAAVTIQIARLYDQRQKFTSRLKELSNIGAQLLAADYNEMKDIIVRFAKEELKADTCTLHQYDSHHKEFLDPDKFSASWPLGGKLQKPRDDGASAVALKEGTLIIPNTETYANSNLIQTAHLIETGVKAYIGIRLEMGKEVLGVLFLNYLYPQEFGEDEEGLVKVLSIYASAAILSARSYLRVLAEQQKENLLVVQEMSNALELHAELSDFLMVLLEKTLARLDAPKGTIQLFNQETNQLEIYAEVGLQGKKERAGISPHQGITGKAFRDRSFIYVPDTKQANDFIPFLGDMRSEMATPIMAGEEKILGVFNVEHPDPYAFADDKVELFKLISAQAGIIVNQKIRLDEETRRRNDAEQKALLTDIVRDTQHYMGNRVSMIQIRADELYKDSSLKLSPIQAKNLQIILNNARAALKASDYILNSRNAPSPDWVNPHDLINEIIGLENEIPEVPVRQKIPIELPLIYADFERTKLALKDLITNGQRAVLENKKSGYVRISARLTENKRYVEFLFTNNGKIIETEKWEGIFKGPGFGLPTARTLMSNQSGNIEVLESNSKQTTFIVRFSAKTNSEGIH